MSVRRTWAALATAALLLAGCSDDPEPRYEPTESPSPSESETSAEPEAQTPEEFLAEWVVLQRNMQNSGDTEAFLAASKGCESCEETARLVERFYADGGFVKTDGRSILEITTLELNKTYDVRVRSAPTKYKEAANGPLQSFPGGVTTYRVTLRPNGQTWILTDELEVSDS